MNDGEIRFFLFLLFCTIVITTLTLSKRLRYKIFRSSGPVYKLTIALHSGEEIILENVMLIIPENIVMYAVKEFDSIQVIPKIKSEELNRLEKKLYADYANADYDFYVKGAIKTFRAWHSGLVVKIFDPLNILPEEERSAFTPAIEEEDFRDFTLLLFLDIKNAEIMPKTTKRIRHQYNTFLQNFFSDENEFLISWAESCLLTNKRLVIMTNEESPTILHNIPLNQILSYKESVTGKRFVE